MTLQHDFILLDRSYSMATNNLWGEAIGSVNAYVKKLADDNIDTAVTVVVFDSQNSFEIIRDRITPKTFRPITNDDATPRAGTPLYDATADLVALANKGAPWGQKYDKVAIIIMTDGDENQSQHYMGADGQKRIKSLLDECRGRGWQVVFLGANFDNAIQASTLGATRGATISASSVNLMGSMRSMGLKRASYSATGAAMNYSDAEKTAFASASKLTDDEVDNLAKGSS